MKPIIFPGKRHLASRKGCTVAGNTINIQFKAAGTLSHKHNAFEHKLPKGYFGQGSSLVSSPAVDGKNITLTFDSGSGAQTVELHIESCCTKPDEPID